MPEQSVIAAYSKMAKVETAVRRMLQSGLTNKSISIVSRNLTSDREVHGYITKGCPVGETMATEAWLGGLFGHLVGAAFIWSPESEALFVIGPLAAELLPGIEGALTNATGCGVLEALRNWGVPQRQISQYRAEVRDGKHLIIIHGTGLDMDAAHGILDKTDADSVAAYGSFDRRL